MAGKRRILATLSVSMLTALALSAPSAANADGPGCQTVRTSVQLSSTDPTTYQIWGQLCGAAPGRTVQLLVSGFTYDHLYWDSPIDPAKYSYVDAMNKAGYATLNIDRIGTGNSGHPPALNVNVDSNAYVVHEIIGKLRAGTIGGVSFPKVIVVGHSLGSVITMTEAGKYHDVDGVVLSGISHNIVTTNVAVLFATTEPTQLDPVLSKQNLPLGYVSTEPGIRKSDFYYTPTADPAVIAYDEAHKSTGTLGELATIPDMYAWSLSITAPVLLIDGQRDQIVCGPLGSSSPCDAPVSYLTTERAFYPVAKSFTPEIVPDTGHDLTLHETAPQFFGDVQQWANDTVGT